MATDQEIRDEGYKFIPPQYYLQSSFVLPQTEEDDQVTESVGIPYTHAFTHSTGDGPGQVPLGLTYDPNAVAATQAASVNNLLQAKGDPIHIKGYEHPASGTEMHGYPTRTFSSVSEGTPAISEAKFPPGIMQIANYDEVFGPKTVVDSVTGKTRTLAAPERFSFPEEEEKESWFSSLFSSTPKVKGTLGTRLKNRPKLPLPSSWFAWTRNPLNPFSPNYNPKFEHQLNYLEMQDNIGRDQASGLLKYGPNTVLRGQNVMSLFGSNDPEEQLQKYIDKMLTRETKAMAKGRQLTAFQQKQLQKARDELSGIKEGGGGNVEHTPTSSQSTYSAEERGSGGEAKDWGKTETRESSGWESSPFEKGGLVNFFKYGGLAGIL